MRQIDDRLIDCLRTFSIRRNLLAQKGAFSEFLIQYLQEQNEEDLAEITEVIEDPDLKFMLQRQASVISQSPDRKYERLKNINGTYFNRINLLDHSKVHCEDVQAEEARKATKKCR